MRVICEKTCVVRTAGSFVSMQRGKSYDLPKEKAESLVRAGYVRPAQARKAAQPTKPRLDLEPQGDGPVSDSPESPAEAAGAAQDDKADSDDEPTAEPSTPKKRSPRTKRLDGSPENK